MKKNNKNRKTKQDKSVYAKELKKQISIKMDQTIIDYFKNLSHENGIPYQTLINMYLSDCVRNSRKIEISWRQEI
ncbi:MAG: BrnA antitoxin family protein [Erysipelotrichaceae bacterium]|nr:BrnA antitoxin family protein [Erysipelotrichaceae bacterium]